MMHVIRYCVSWRFCFSKVLRMSEYAEKLSNVRPNVIVLK